MPSAAILTGGRARPFGGLDKGLLLACDMPGVTTALIAHLLRLVPGHQAVVPRAGSGYHPLCAVYTRDIRVIVERRLTEGLLDFRGLLQEIVVGDLSGPELDDFGNPAQLLADVNTPSAHDAFSALRPQGR